MMLYNKNFHVVRLSHPMSYDYPIPCRTTITSHVVRHDNLMKARHKMFGIRCWCGMWNEVYVEYDMGFRCVI